MRRSRAVQPVSIPARHPSPAPPTNPALYLLVGARRVPLGPEPIVFGRDPACDVSLAADALVSRRHARVFIRGGQVYVDDLDARNGTFVNGRRARHSVLRPGDILRIGSTEITFPG